MLVVNREITIGNPRMKAQHKGLPDDHPGELLDNQDPSLCRLIRMASP